MAELTKEANIAYQAFQVMRKSKKIYVSFLQNIDVKYKSGGEASDAEIGELTKLLADHDNNVTVFNTTMAAVEDTDARNRLIELMS